MDGVGRVGALLATVLAATATTALLGAQGARVGPFPVPELSPWWVVAAAALVLMATPHARTSPETGSRKRKTKKQAIAGAAFALSFLLLSFWRHEALTPKASLDFLVGGTGTGGVVRRGSSLQLERRNELRRLTGRRRNVELETTGLLEVPRAGAYRFDLSCDDSCELELGPHVLRARGEGSETFTLDAGEIPFALHYRQRAGPARLVVRWRTPAAFEPLPLDYFLRASGAAPRNRVPAHAALAALAIWWCGFSYYLAGLGSVRKSWIGNPWVPATLAGLLILYGTVLRFEALLAHSGLARENDRAADLYDALAPYLPDYSLLNPENAPDDPYRADVRSYLDRAQSMGLGPRAFYAPSFREPFYPLLVRIFVGLAGGEIGILVLTFVFSALTLPLFYFVGRRLYGSFWAAALLLPVSVHEWLVLEAPTGYRMSVYAFLLLGFVGFVAFVGVGRPTRLAAVAAGVLGGLLCLVRLSALSVIAPVAALSALDSSRGRSRRELAILVSAFGTALALVVVPFLWSNFRAHGDPFYSVSFHTEFWLRAEGIGAADEGPVSLTRYFTDFGRTGRVLRGTLEGLTVLPLRTFWNGSIHFPLLAVTTLALGVPGLLLAARGRQRLLPAAYLGHLLPFAYIQNFPSGEMPRFVMPAYFFLILAIPIAVDSARRLGSSRGGKREDRLTPSKGVS